MAPIVSHYLTINILTRIPLIRFAQMQPLVHVAISTKVTYLQARYTDISRLNC